MTFPNAAAFAGKFAEEARDRLKVLTAALLRLEEVPGNRDAAADVLRQAHNIKGSARMLGFLDISDVVHAIEELVVGSTRDGSAMVPPAFDTLFAAVDVLGARVEQLAGGVTDPADVTAVCEQLTRLARPDGQPSPAAPARPGDSAGTAGTHEGVLTPGVRHSLRVPVERLNGLTHMAAELVIQSLQTSQRHLELRRLNAMLGRLRDRMREARLAPSTQASAAAREVAECAEALDHVSSRLRQFLGTFSDDCVRLNLITEEFRQTVIELTMLPLSTVFDAFPRAARDLARHFDKEVELTIRGGDTELDKKIIEQISDPMIHLLRNAIDHGIETPAERVRKGKPPSGHLLIAAEQQGNRIVVTMRDDGQGIDLEVLRAAAPAHGAGSAADLAGWTDASLLELIFSPGFSTRAAATDVSGRGVGMDVVRDVVRRLGGAVRVQSGPGGTTILLDLPLSLALLRVVLVEAGGELFAVPTAAVRRLLHVQSDTIAARLADGIGIEVDDEMISLSSMSALLNGFVPPAPAQRQPVLVAASGDRSLALVVEAVHEEQELVFEELRHPMRDQRTFSGAAILGNGDIVPILDVSALIDLALEPPVAAKAAPPAARVDARAGRVLVVEDSLVAGELQKSILAAAGYDVEIARDGAEALEMLLQRTWDLVVADLDMPRMDGFELTATLRGDPRFRTLPIVIVTARESSADRRRGFEAGADAYVLKREFDQVHLLETVQRLIGRTAGAHA